MHELQETLRDAEVATEAARRQARRAAVKQTHAEMLVVRMRQAAEAGLRRRAFRGVLRAVFRRWLELLQPTPVAGEQTAAAAAARQPQLPPPLPAQRSQPPQDPPQLHTSIDTLQKVAEGLRRDVLALRTASPAMSPARSTGTRSTRSTPGGAGSMREGGGGGSRLSLAEEEEWQELLQHRQTAPLQEVGTAAPVEADQAQRLRSCGVGPKKLESLRQRLKAHSYGQSGQDPRKLFQHFDRDNTGDLDFKEFKAAVRKVGRMTAQQISDKVSPARSAGAPASPPVRLVVLLPAFATTACVLRLTWCRR